MKIYKRMYIYAPPVLMVLLWGIVIILKLDFLMDDHQTEHSNLLLLNSDESTLLR